MTPDPRIAEIRDEDVERVARELFMRHMVYSGYNQETKESMFITDTLSRDYARAALEATLSDRERAIDEAVKGERERCTKIAEIWGRTKPQSGPHATIIAGAIREAGQAIAATIRRPTDTGDAK